MRVLFKAPLSIALYTAIHEGLHIVACLLCGIRDITFFFSVNSLGIRYPHTTDLNLFFISILPLLFQFAYKNYYFLGMAFGDIVVSLLISASDISQCIALQPELTLALFIYFIATFPFRLEKGMKMEFFYEQIASNGSLSRRYHRGYLWYQAH